MSGLAYCQEGPRKSEILEGACSEDGSVNWDKVSANISASAQCDSTRIDAAKDQIAQINYALMFKGWHDSACQCVFDNEPRFKEVAQWQLNNSKNAVAMAKLTIKDILECLKAGTIDENGNVSPNRIQQCKWWGLESCKLRLAENCAGYDDMEKVTDALAQMIKLERQGNKAQDIATLQSEIKKAVAQVIIDRENKKIEKQCDKDVAQLRQEHNKTLAGIHNVAEKVMETNRNVYTNSVNEEFKDIFPTTATPDENDAPVNKDFGPAL